MPASPTPVAIAPSPSSAVSTTPNRLTSVELAYLAALVAIGAALRLYGINSGLWYDEIVTLVESVRLPLADIIGKFAGDNHHPLYSVAAHVSVMVFGESAWALRLPAALIGVATIPVLYLVGRAVTTRVEAGAAAAILTVSYHHVWFSQNARGYTAVLFCVLMSTYALLRWYETGRRSYLVLYAVTTALGSYAHLTTVLVAVGQALACGFYVITRRGTVTVATEARELAAAFVGAALLTVACYAPMLMDVGSVMTSGASSGGDKTALSWTIGAVLQGMKTGFGALWAVMLGAIVLMSGGMSFLRRRPIVAMLFVLPVLVTVSAALILNRPLRPRFMFFAFGFALLFTVRGAGTLGALAGALVNRPRIRSAGGPAAVVLLTLAAVALSVRSLPYGYRYPKQDYDHTAEFVDRSVRQGDLVAVVADGGEIPLVRYMGRPWTRIDTGADLRRLRSGGRPVWVVSTFPSYVRSKQPELWTLLQTECTELRKFVGTVEDGSLTVRRCP